MGFTTGGSCNWRLDIVFGHRRAVTIFQIRVGLSFYRDVHLYLGTLFVVNKPDVFYFVFCIWSFVQACHKLIVLGMLVGVVSGVLEELYYSKQ